MAAEGGTTTTRATNSQQTTPRPHEPRTHKTSTNQSPGNKENSRNTKNETSNIRFSIYLATPTRKLSLMCVMVPIRKKEPAERFMDSHLTFIFTQPKLPMSNCQKQVAHAVEPAPSPRRAPWSMDNLASNCSHGIHDDRSTLERKASTPL